MRAFNHGVVMFACSLALLATLAAAPAPAPVKPSVAIFRLNPEFGVAQGVANLMGERIASLLRDSGVFGRVVSSADLESLLDLERQKQMTNCANDSCVAELAGALGVEFLVVGSVGKLGASFLLNLKMIDVRRTLTVAAISERLVGNTEEALLDGSLPAVRKMLSKAGMENTLKEEAPKPTPVAAPVAPVAPAPAAPVAQADAPAAAARPAWVFPVLGVGGALFAVGVVGVLVGLVGGVLTGAFAVYNLEVRDYRPFLELGKDKTRQNNLIAIYVLMGGTAAVVGLLGLVVGVVGTIGGVVAALKI